MPFRFWPVNGLIKRNGSISKPKKARRMAEQGRPVRRILPAERRPGWLQRKAPFPKELPPQAAEDYIPCRSGEAPPP